MEVLPKLLTPANHPKFREHLRVFCAFNKPTVIGERSNFIGLEGAEVSAFSLNGGWMELIRHSLWTHAQGYREGNLTGEPPTFAFEFELSEDDRLVIAYQPDDRRDTGLASVFYQETSIEFVVDGNRHDAGVIPGLAWADVDEGCAPAILYAHHATPQRYLDTAARILSIRESNWQARLLARSYRGDVCPICFESLETDVEKNCGIHTECASPMGISVNESMAEQVLSYLRRGTQLCTG